MTTLTGRAILVGTPDPLRINVLILYPGTSRFFDINDMKKPEGYEKEQG